MDKGDHYPDRLLEFNQNGKISLNLVTLCKVVLIALNIVGSDIPIMRN